MEMNVNGTLNFLIVLLNHAQLHLNIILQREIVKNIILRVIVLQGQEEVVYRNQIVKMLNYKQHAQHQLIINNVFGNHIDVENKFVMIFQENQKKNVLFMIVLFRIHQYMVLNVQLKRNVKNLVQKILVLKVLMVYVSG